MHIYIYYIYICAYFNQYNTRCIYICIHICLINMVICIYVIICYFMHTMYLAVSLQIDQIARETSDFPPSLNLRSSRGAPPGGQRVVAVQHQHLWSSPQEFPQKISIHHLPWRCSNGRFPESWGSRGTPIAGCFRMENPNLKWMITRCTPIYGNPQLEVFKNGGTPILFRH